jgi:uncharacterized iron-regulated membrane protein
MKWHTFRRAVFQVHLWLAITLGIYIVVISVSGSAVVFRREATRWLLPPAVIPTEGERLTGELLESAVRDVYADYEIVSVRESQRPERPVSVELSKGEKQSSRLFDPYSGEDLGDTYPPSLRAMEWLVELHDDLLAGELGRQINGVAAGLVLVLILTGATIWWPGKSRWRQSLLLTRSTPASRFVWQLHSVLGIWSLLLLLIWTLTAIYFAFPSPVENLIDRYDPDLTDFKRPGEAFLLKLISLHFGRFGGLGIRILWTLLGLLPAALFVTGFIVWWRRVVRRRLARWRATPPPSAARPASDAARDPAR